MLPCFAVLACPDAVADDNDSEPDVAFKNIRFNSWISSRCLVICEVRSADGSEIEFIAEVRDASGGDKCSMARRAD